MITNIFPISIYTAKRDSGLDFSEKKDIKDIIEEGMKRNTGNTSSNNSYIFNGKLKNIKQFCEEHIKTYVEQVIYPKEELDFYITQSWLNITKPGEFHHNHSHMNSIVSGVFYIQTVEDDKIMFQDPNLKIKEMIDFKSKGPTIRNTTMCACAANTNELILFPSWLNHLVMINEKATTDRISLSFNTFVRGKLGSRADLTELIL